MANFKRAVVQATSQWRDRRRSSMDGIGEGLSSGSFAGIETNLYADEGEAPDVSELETSLLQAWQDADSDASRGFCISHHSQLAILEAEKRTGVLRRMTRRGALALLRSELEDGRRRDDQLETLLLVDDVPEGLT